MPDQLMQKAKQAIARRGMTFRELVIDAVEKAVSESPKRFVLRDASAGYSARGAGTVGPDRINRAIDEMREPGTGI